MQDVTLSEFSWRKPKRDGCKIELQHCETQTDSVSRRDADTLANFQTDKQIQTDDVELEVATGGGTHIEISPSVVKMILEFIHENDTKVKYDRLLEFHDLQDIRLEAVHSYHIETRNENIVKMISHSSRKTLFLFGGSSHETFCSHQPRTFLTSSCSTTSLPLAVCALTCTFYNSTRFVIGDINGCISMCSREQILFTAKISEGAITCVEMSRHGLLTASDDGFIELWQILKSNFEKMSSTRLTVADLPRRIRNASTSNKPLAIVSMQISGDYCCAASETGGIYVIALPTLDFKAINQAANSIRQIVYQHPFIGILFHSMNSLIINGENVIDQLPIQATDAVRCGRYLIFSDSHRLILWSSDSSKIALDSEMECQQISTISADTLQILENSTNNLVSYFINDRM